MGIVDRGGAPNMCFGATFVRQLPKKIRDQALQIGSLCDFLGLLFSRLAREPISGLGSKLRRNS